MTRRLALVALPALVASVLVHPQSISRADVSSILIASPFEGHSGDTIYLSGAGLDPKQHLYVMMACPNWHDPSVFRYGNIKFEPSGPTTDGRGEFTAFPFQVLTLRGIPSLGCQIYVQYGQNPYGPDFPAQFTILGARAHAHRCALQICVHIKTSPVRVRSGFTEYINIAHDKTGPWPGAQADVMIVYPDGKTQRSQVILNIKGDAVARLRIDAHYAQTVPANVVVRVHMGGMAGRWTGRFTVVH